MDGGSSLTREPLGTQYGQLFAWCSSSTSHSSASAALYRSRGAIEQEVAQNLSNPQHLLYAKPLVALFEGTPYAHDALGTKASFDRTTGAMLKKFGDTWYAPNNAILVVVGDVQPDAALARIEAYFGKLRPEVLPRRPEVVLRPVRTRTLYLPTDQASGLAVVAFRVPGYADGDYAAMRVLGARWPHAQRTESTPRVRPSGAASQLNPSHRSSGITPTRR